MRKFFHTFPDCVINQKKQQLLTFDVDLDSRGLEAHFVIGGHDQMILLHVRVLHPDLPARHELRSLRRNKATPMTLRHDCVTASRSDRDGFIRVSIRRGPVRPPNLHIPPLWPRTTALHMYVFLPTPWYIALINRLSIALINQWALRRDGVLDNWAFDRGRVLIAGHKPRTPG